jgi:hypothetical protein
LVWQDKFRLLWQADREFGFGRASRRHDGAGSEARLQNAGPTANAGLESRNSVSLNFGTRACCICVESMAFGASIKVRIFATEGELSGAWGHPESLAISEPTNLV